MLLKYSYAEVVRITNSAVYDDYDCYFLIARCMMISQLKPFRCLAMLLRTLWWV